MDHTWYCNLCTEAGAAGIVRWGAASHFTWAHWAACCLMKSRRADSACLVLSRSTSWMYLFYCATYYKTKRNLVTPPSFSKCGRNWAVRLKLIAVGQTVKLQTVKLQNVTSLRNSLKCTFYHVRVVPPNKSTSQEIFSQLSTPADELRELCHLILSSGLPQSRDGVNKLSFLVQVFT